MYAVILILLCVKDMSHRTFKSIFEGKQDVLEEKIETDGLLSKLEAEKVITKRHRITIEVSFVAVDKLLKLILTIRYDSVYLTCSKKLTASQLGLPHGINKK